MALTSRYRFSGSNQRQFYKRWSELMAADIWSDLQETNSRLVAGFKPSFP